MPDGLGVFEAGFASWSRVLSVSASDELRLTNFRHLCIEAASYVDRGLDKAHAVDELLELADAHGLLVEVGRETVEAIIAKAFEQPAEQPNKTNGAQEPKPAPQATPYLPPDPATIPPRAWLHAGHYIRDAATATVAPGGFGKTTLQLYEAITMVAAGNTVWYLSGEDPRVEVDRRIAAHCALHHVTLAELPGRLFVDDRNSFPLFIGKSPRPASVVFDEASLGQFEMAIREAGIDVVLLDPFVSFHAVPENDNGAIDAVVKRLALIAYRTNSGIELSHHVRKPFAGQGSLTVDDARGGTSIINAVRSGRVINRMSAVEAQGANISDVDRHFYIRIDTGKRNMAPPDKATWYRLTSVAIDNGDHVQALLPYDYRLAELVGEDDTQWVRELVRAKAYRADPHSPDWLGIRIAQRFNLNIADKADCIKINRMIGAWLTCVPPAFQKMELRDAGARKKFMFYVALDARSEADKQDKDLTANIIQLFDQEREDDT